MHSRHEISLFSKERETGLKDQAQTERNVFQNREWIGTD